MRSLFGSLAALLMTLVIGCTWVDPGECWPNTSGGFGGGGTIPIGAVGASGSGDYISEPPKGPLDKDGTPNPCMASESPQQSTCQGGNTAPDGATITVCSSGCSGKCTTVNGGPFAPSIFNFVTIIPDDGTAGGWQEARASLRIVRLNYLVIPETWYCPVRVGMPLRTTVNGPISPAYAATVTAEVANQAATKIRNQDPDLPQGIFCIRIKAEMTSLFDSSTYASLGAKMMNP